MLDEVNDRFRTVYNKLNKDTLEVLSDLYDVNVVFIDPIHTVHGLGQGCVVSRCTFVVA